jgi:uncharacterized alkaline shock family protein YloU
MMGHGIGARNCEVKPVEHEIAAGDEKTSSVKIADEVVGVIAGIAASEVEGVASMSGGVVSGFGEMLGKKSFSKGVKVEVGESQTALDLYVVMDYGIRIPDVARRVQENVKRAVESMTGLEVVEVNVHVAGVSFHTEARDDEVRLRT